MTAELGQPVNLLELKARIRTSEYMPEVKGFSVLVLRPKKLRNTVNVTPTGKLTVNATSIQEGRQDLQAAIALILHNV